MSRAGVPGPWNVTAIRAVNHVLMLECAAGRFFLKAHTRDWYASDPDRAPGLAVRHEAAAWECLRRHGLATPEVVLVDESADNPLRWPHLVTRELAGAPAGALAEQSGLVRAGALLEALGGYVRRMHDIAFRNPGYVMTPDGPEQPLEPHDWHHACHTADEWQRWALRGLETAGLPTALRREIEARLSQMADGIRSEYEPPRFTQGDSHASHYLVDVRGGPHVTGVVDMEVASAGNPVYDLILIVTELMARVDARTQWWEPFFAGYGGAPDLERFRLGLLSTGEANFKAHGEGRWPATPAETYRGLLAAKTWAELFSANRGRS
jgi:aminoglycoside phosphotransferase (APT) family kinase protein